MGFLDRLKKGPTHDEASIRRLLESEGATPEEASTLVQTLGRRLSPDEMHVWLCDPEKAHGVPDPETEATVGVALNWTPINAVANGKASS